MNTRGWGPSVAAMLRTLLAAVLMGAFVAVAQGREGRRAYVVTQSGALSPLSDQVLARLQLAADALERLAKFRDERGRVASRALQSFDGARRTLGLLKLRSAYPWVIEDNGPVTGIVDVNVAVAALLPLDSSLSEVEQVARGSGREHHELLQVANDVAVARRMIAGDPVDPGPPTPAPPEPPVSDGPALLAALKNERRLDRRVSILELAEADVRLDAKDAKAVLECFPVYDAYRMRAAAVVLRRSPPGHAFELAALFPRDTAGFARLVKNPDGPPQLAALAHADRSRLLHELQKGGLEARLKVLQAWTSERWFSTEDVALVLKERFAWFTDGQMQALATLLPRIVNPERPEPVLGLYEWNVTLRTDAEKRLSLEVRP